MKRSLLCFVAMAGMLALTAACGRAEKAVPLQALARLPVREITVFKDGHAFVLHRGVMPTDAAGGVVMDYLPTPVMGTFWPYVAEGHARLSAVTANQRKVRVDRTALNLRELIEANVGARVTVTETSGDGTNRVTFGGAIWQVPTQSGDELEALSAPYTGEKLPQKGTVVLFQTGGGIKVVGLDQIANLTFVDPPRTTVPQEEFRNVLTLKLDWGNQTPPGEADVGMVYVQRGLRWIPNYKVTIDGQGNAGVKLQATVINELADLEDVTAHLVIGVPSFAFKDSADPISLEQTVAQLSRNFREDNQTAFALSNAIMTQQATPPLGRRLQPAEEGGRVFDLGPELAESGKNEDLFVFTLRHISLRKGQRLVLSIAEFKVKYRDIYSLDIAYAPPPEAWHNFNPSHQSELARLFNAPKVAHKIRLANRSEYPLTTAPALILHGERVVAQGLITYTAVGAESDLDLTTAVDVRVKKADQETQRTPNAVLWNGDQYSRIDLTGKITLTSFAAQPLEVEITRQVLGNVDKADHEGRLELINLFEEATFSPGGNYPSWWNWFSWPYWWYHFNSVGRIAWQLRLEPGQPVDLNYAWHYFWR